MSTDKRGVAWTRGVSWHKFAAAAAVVPLAALATPLVAQASDQGQQSVIVEYGSSPGDAANLVDSVLPRGLARKSFATIPGVAVTIPQHFVDQLESAGALVVPDSSVAFQSGFWGDATTGAATSCPGNGSPSTPSGYFPADTGSDRLVAGGDNGAGSTVAVLDTGIDAALPDLSGRVIGGVDLTGGNSPYTDQFGHGTFIAGLIAGNGASSNGQYVGEAPGADLVSIKVAGATGQTTISSVITGIEWAIANKYRYGINVLNLSLGAVPTGPTAQEPMDRAVEQAWRAGITVVTSAGNSGPSYGTIVSPGDDPLAITVGAYADNNSSSPANWYACPFSSVGPTLFDGWFKPDLVAPGRSVVSLLDPGSTIATSYPSAVVGTGNFVGSGTSFSTAITAGAAALVYSAYPNLTPNMVKARLLGSAMPSETGNPLVEGHGFLNAWAAVNSPNWTLNQSRAALAEWTGSQLPVSFSSVWAPSSWNSQNWSTINPYGSAWTGSAWTGAAWNGSAWTGSAWTGSAWTGSAWTGSAWTGSAWTGSAWTGAAWNGSAWTGSAWTGSAWTTSAWNTSAWNGSAWTGSAWTGSAWTGSAWTGSAWTGSAWTGSSWT